MRLPPLGEETLSLHPSRVRCDEHQKISAQLEEQYAQKVSAASNEAVVRNEVVTRKQERRKNRLTALNSVRSILEEEDDDMLLLEQMEVRLSPVYSTRNTLGMLHLQDPTPT